MQEIYKYTIMLKSGEKFVDFGNVDPETYRRRLTKESALVICRDKCGKDVRIKPQEILSIHIEKLS